jgi:hypothetical protein
LIAAIIAALALGACSGRSGLFKQYEYEEEMYLSLDGTATFFVNSSVPALDALRGAGFDARPNARLDLSAVRQYYTTPATRVTRVTSSRRNNRRFAHVRIEVDDVSRLSEADPLAWSSYVFSNDGRQASYRQIVGASANQAVDGTRWNGDELVAFRLHVPSDVLDDNSPTPVQRGNILEWEQPLAERLKGVPVTIDVRMSAESILSRTLLLFGGMIAAVAIMFGALIWWIARRGRSASMS